MSTPTPTIDPNYKHPKCYANTRGGCSEKISGEHYLSYGLLKLFSFEDPQFKIMHNNGLGVRYPVQPKEFKTNVLCTTHNQALSPADTAAIEFATFLRRIALTWLGGAGEWGSGASLRPSQSRGTTCSGGC